jgi:integrase
MSGHIRRRGTRSWELKFDVPRDGGGRRTAYKSFKGSKREAQAELAKLIAAAADGGHVDPSRLTVAQYIHERFSHWQATGVITPGTAQRYEQLIDGQILPHLGNKLLQRLTTRDIETWHRILLTAGRRGRNGRPDGEGGLSARTVGHAHRVLHKVLREAIRHDLLVKNPCTAQRPPKVISDEMQILTPQQVADLPAQLHGHVLEVPTLVALFCGLRRGEILALRFGDMDFDDEVIHVRRSLEETTVGGLRFKSPKSKAGVRDVTLPAIVTDALLIHRRLLLERRLLLGQGKPADSDLMFPDWQGRPWSPNAFGATWSKLATELGLGVSFHGLRHTHASQLIASGKVDIVTISKRLGHSSPDITLRIYAHLFHKDDSKAAAAINAALGVPA